MPPTITTKSPRAAADLEQRVASGELSVASEDCDAAMGATDCPSGCVVEPDGRCPHDYESAALTAGLI